MRIAFITYEYPPDIAGGGIATYVYETSRMLHHYGINVEVFSGSIDREGTFVEDGIIVNRCIAKDPSLFSQEVLKIFSKRHLFKKFDIIETPEINANAEHIVRTYSEIPYVTKLHTPVSLQIKLYNYYTPLHKKIRFVLGALKRGRVDLGFWRRKEKYPECDPDYRMAVNASMISAPSNAMKKWAVRYWCIPDSRIVVIPNAYQPIGSNHQSDYDFEKREYLTFVGKLNVHKGLVNLTKALSSLLLKNPKLKVRFIGDDGSSHIPGITMKTYIQKTLNPYLDRVEFAGKVPEAVVHNLLRQARICVFPSIWEAFGYVVLEAMNVGVPVIVSRGSGMEEIVENGKYGILINPMSSKDIEKKIKNSFSDKQLLLNLSSKGMKRVRDAYSYKKLFARHYSFYKKVAGQ